MFGKFICLFVLIAVLATLQTSLAAYCHGTSEPGERVNELEILNEAPKFIRSVKNGALYEAGPENQRFKVVHLYGNAYEVGFAQGTLLKKEVKQFVSTVWAYLSSELVSALSGDKISDFTKQLIVQYGMDKALDWTREVTEPFTPQAYYDEIKGLSDASGVDYDLLYRLQMFPELTKAACSFLGAWDSATVDGKTFQLRALDYDVDGPFKDFPQVTVYHPTDGGHAYAQVGFTANIGAMTGYSSAQIGISEIGVSYPDDSFGQGTDNTPPEKVKGEPWMFVLRDVLQFETSLESAKARVTNANRTCNLIIGIGDGKNGKVNGVEYSGRVANFYDDSNQIPVADWHPTIKDVVYNGMDWLCPGFTQPLGEQLQKYYGKIDENTIIHNILPTVQTGNLHIAVYDLTNSNMHVSFARASKTDPSEPLNAYARQFTRLNMKAIFDLPAPAV